MKKPFKKALLATMFAGLTFTASSCSIDDLFVFKNNFKIDETLLAKGIESFAGCDNSIFFALYNYYGFEGQNFTYRWLGMREALLKHGIEVTNYEENLDAPTFKIKRLSTCDLPKDADIYMVNNQEWDPSIQFKIPFQNHRPMAVISTCNGVEFAADEIKAAGFDISNGTFGGFSPYYKDAFEKGTLKYLASKYSAHLLPILAASADAVDRGRALRNADGSALELSIENWPIQTIDQYNEMNEADSIEIDHPTLRLLNIKDFFDPTKPEYGADKLTEWVANKSKEDIKALYDLNASNGDQDTVRNGRRLKVGILAPSGTNDQVSKYIEFIKGYAAHILNYDFITKDVTGSSDQVAGCRALIGSKCDIIISLQDDTNRVKAIEEANKAKVYFAVGGACLNPGDYEKVKNLPYYVGSVGTSNQADYNATYQMTDYYLNCMIERAKGNEELVKYQAAVKNIDISDIDFEA